MYYTFHHARIGRVEEVGQRGGGLNRSLSGMEHKNGKFQASFEIIGQKCTHSQITCYDEHAIFFKQSENKQTNKPGTWLGL